MTRVVLDTNVLISALLTEHGAPAAVLSLIESGELLWCVSAPILTEYHAVIERPKFAVVRRDRVDAVLRTLDKAPIFTTTVIRRSISAHEPDNRFLECAEAAEADYLVTGNIRHFPAVWRNTQIVNPRQLLSLIAS